MSSDKQYVAYKHDRAMVQSIRAMVMEHPGCHMMYSSSNVHILVGIAASDSGVVFLKSWDNTYKANIYRKQGAYHGRIAC